MQRYANFSYLSHFHHRGALFSQDSLFLITFLQCGPKKNGNGIQENSAGFVEYMTRNYA